YKKMPILQRHLFFAFSSQLPPIYERERALLCLRRLGSLPAGRQARLAPRLPARQGARGIFQPSPADAVGLGQKNIRAPQTKKGKH
ncbi:MAG: hypothetical protein AAB645_00395, partial [Patescibacteria group bacterium]